MRTDSNILERTLRPPVGDLDHVLGEEAAPVTLLQYGDYECPVSREIYRIVKELRKHSPGEVRYAYRHFPLNKVHPHAERAAAAAEAAGAHGKYWEMHERLFQNQDDLEDEDLSRYAKSIGLEGKQFSADLEDDSLSERVREDRKYGVKSSVTSTSNLFINGNGYGGRMAAKHVAAAVEEVTGVRIAADDGRGARPPAVDGRGQRPLARRRTLTDICAENRGVDQDVLESVLTLALEIAREGREGRKIGTLFAVGDADAVMASSRPLVMDPLLGHPDEEKHIELPNLRETVKELAQLDGAFVVTRDGVVRTAARFLDASSRGVDLPLGLGSRHMAGASISLHTGAVAVVVSESSMVRLFRSGKVETEIVPELWMLKRYGLEPIDREAGGAGDSGEVTVLERSTKDAGPGG